ncbi:MAG: HesB/IscA family protein [Pseudomonadota bacterium]
MTVSNFDPQTIIVTDAARAHLRAQIAQSGQPYLRLGVKESGCNGYMYTLDYLDAPTERDRAYSVGDGVTLYVNDDDLALVRGTEVDYVTEGLNASLRFRNPNAATYCGCGESFAVAAASE